VDKRKPKTLRPASGQPPEVGAPSAHEVVAAPAGPPAEPVVVAVVEPKVIPLRAPPPSVRRALIDSLATALGQSWAKRSREALHRDGRAAAGGWPGTVGEATAYVAQALLSDQYRLPNPMLTPAERELLARAVYASARHEWLRHLDPEAPKQKRDI
jgi:hypothetical protein